MRSPAVLVGLVWADVGDGVGVCVPVGSRHPHQPGLSHVEVDEGEDCVVEARTDVVGTDRVGASVVVVTVLLAFSLQPNQPGVRQVVVV